MNIRQYNSALTVDYKALGTISTQELMHAVIEDVHALEDLYAVRFVTGGRLFLPVTNQYGDPMRIRHPQGGPVSRIDTHHYRPACKDYDL